MDSIFFIQNFWFPLLFILFLLFFLKRIFFNIYKYIEIIKNFKREILFILCRIAAVIRQQLRLFAASIIFHRLPLNDKRHGKFAHKID